MNGLLNGVVAMGLAITISLALTVSVHLWLATTSPSEEYSGGSPVPSYTTPELHP